MSGYYEILRRAIKKNLRKQLEQGKLITCQYCKKNITLKEFTLDHVIAKSKGGKNKKSNLIIACKNCNERKGNKSLEEFLPLMTKD